MHCFVDISSHGYGHLAITAPVLNAFSDFGPDFRLTVRSALPEAKLRQRIRVPFEWLPTASDFGYVMHDATRIDLPASAAAYRAAHRCWAQRVEDETLLLRQLQPDVVLTSVSYLPLAGARRAGIPAFALCSLNWADLFAHYFGSEDWAAAIHAEMLAAYRGAEAFLRVTPGMPMPAIENLEPIAPIATLGRRHDLGLGEARTVLIAMGGIAHRLPVENWPRLRGIRWLVPADWACHHPDALPWESFGLGFTDLLCSVDAVLTKPGYGTFTEAACNGTPVLYQRRDDWPEQACLIAWLATHGRSGEVTPEQIRKGNLADALAALWAQDVPPVPLPAGARQAAERIRSAGSRSA